MTSSRRSASPTQLPGEWIDETTLKVAKEAKPGDVLDYVFDFGDDWNHRCTMEPEKADSEEEYGAKPTAPVPIWGWGAIPRPVLPRLAGLSQRAESAR